MKFSTPIPKTSAACIEIDVLVPPMSVEPSTSATEPSLFTVSETADFNPTLNQYPEATPLPLTLP